MDTIKLTYLLEVEVPADTLLTDGNAYAQAVHRLLRWNEPRGWKARLRRLVGVQAGSLKIQKTPAKEVPSV